MKCTGGGKSMADFNPYQETFREERLIHNLKRIIILNFVYMIFILWTIISNIISLYILQFELQFPLLLTLLYGGFLLVNICSFLFVKYYINTGKIKITLRFKERFIYTIILISTLWGASISILHQQIYFHILVYTFSLLFCAALFYIPLKPILLITITTSTILFIGIFLLQENFLIMSLLTIFIISIDTAAILLANTLHKHYEKTFTIQEKLRLENERNFQLSKRLELEANFDFLTQMLNRRGLKNKLETIITEHNHKPKYATTLLIDVDYFKQYNDFYGHAKGDIVLHTVGKTIIQVAHNYGIITARWGGEEFLGVTHHYDPTIVAEASAALCQAIQDLQIPHEVSDISSFISISIGTATGIFESFEDIEKLIEKADGALYSVKKQGRNNYAHA